MTELEATSFIAGICLGVFLSFFYLVMTMEDQMNPKVGQIWHWRTMPDYKVTVESVVEGVLSLRLVSGGVAIKSLDSFFKYYAPSTKLSNILYGAENE